MALVLRSCSFHVHLCSRKTRALQKLLPKRTWTAPTQFTTLNKCPTSCTELELWYLSPGLVISLSRLSKLNHSPCSQLTEFFTMSRNNAINAVSDAEFLSQDTGVHARVGSTAKGAQPILRTGLLSSQHQLSERDASSSITMASNKRVWEFQPSKTIYMQGAPLKITIRLLKSTSRLNRVNAGFITA